jgi:MoxR-like ATPase
MGFPTSLRRHVVMAAAELFNWEVEYMAITRDTTEADLKQRREIVGDSVRYFDQAPVRAAVQGRVLVLDGIENAERNVLPCLNNLLENREMALDDGSFLSNKIAPAVAAGDMGAGISPPGDAARIVPVHPDFRVIALGLPVPPFPGRTLDPPLRSRFQVCIIGSSVLFLIYFIL